VNLEGGKIKMTNLKENGVPLHLYDRTQMNGNNYYFSYALYSGKELSHPVTLSENYDYEVFGPNGFFRKFKGKALQQRRLFLLIILQTIRLS
jgi:phospholipase C